MNSSNSKNETTGFWFGWITTRSCRATFYYCTCQPFNVRYESLCHLIHFFSRNDSRIKVKKTVSFLKLELFIPTGSTNDFLLFLFLFFFFLFFLFLLFLFLFLFFFFFLFLFFLFLLFRFLLFHSVFYLFYVFVWRRAYAWNVRLYPYRQYTNLFILPFFLSSCFPVTIIDLVFFSLRIMLFRLTIHCIIWLISFWTW